MSVGAVSWLDQVRRFGLATGRAARRRLIRRAAVGLALLFAAVAGTTERDLHDYWDTRCRDCHGDAGAFARRTLRVEDGVLVGAHHTKDLDRFLRNHYLTDDLLRPVTAMLTAQVQSAPLFRNHCSGCHGSAAEFARRSLVLRGGVLTGVTSARPVADLLRNHGGLAPAEVDAMVTTLTRVLGEVAAPGTPGREGR